MNWFIIALIPPILWAIANHLDKYLLEKYLKTLGFGSLILFTPAMGTILLPIIFLIEPDVLQISPLHAAIIIGAGFIFSLSWIPYLYALNQDETSRVTPLYETIPVFAYLLGLLFLNETISLNKILASLLILVGALGLSLQFHSGRVHFKKSVIWLMLLSSLMLTAVSLLFKIVAIEESFWLTLFWEYVGMFLAGLAIFAFMPNYRSDFIQVFKRNSKWVLGLNALDEFINLGAKAILSLATLSAPLVLVWVASETQPFFTFLLGVIITIFWPKFAQENITKKVLLQKIIAILIMFLGAYLLNK